MRNRLDLLGLECAAALTVPAGCLLAWLTFRQESPACVLMDSGRCEASGLGNTVIASIILAISLFGGAVAGWQFHLKRRGTCGAARQIGHTFGQIAACGAVFLATVMLARLGGVLGAAVSLRSLILFDAAMLVTIGALAGRVPAGVLVRFLDKRPIAGRLAHDRAKRLGGILLVATGLATAVAAGMSGTLALGVLCCGIVVSLFLSFRLGWRLWRGGLPAQTSTAQSDVAGL